MEAIEETTSFLSYFKVYLHTSIVKIPQPTQPASEVVQVRYVERSKSQSVFRRLSLACCVLQYDFTNAF